MLTNPEIINTFTNNKIIDIRHTDRFIVYEFKDMEVRIGKEKTSQLLSDLIKYNAMQYNKSAVEKVLRDVHDSK